MPWSPIKQRRFELNFESVLENEPSHCYLKETALQTFKLLNESF